MSVTQGTSGYFNAQVAGSGASTTVGEINRWTITKTSDPIDVSVFGDRWRDYVNGSVGWTCSASGFFDCESSANQGSLEDSIDNGTSIEIYAHVDDTKYYYGLAYITNITVEDSHDGVVTASFDAQGSGILYQTCV